LDLRQWRCRQRRWSVRGSSVGVEIKKDTVMDVREQKRLFLLNRALIVLAVAAVLAGLFFDQWRIVLRNAILL
jgi:hypothetical protein